MTTQPCLPSRNEDYGFFRTLTVCPERDRRSAEVWTLASRLIAEAIGASSEDEMIGIRDFLDSRIGRHFADDVVGNMTGCNIGLEAAIAAAIRRWQGWHIEPVMSSTSETSISLDDRFTSEWTLTGRVSSRIFP